jgi:UDP-glucose 4-epimerase
MMRPVQEQIPPPLRGTAGNHRRRPMRALTTDRLTIPGSELPRTAEVSHGPMLAALATVGHRQAAQLAPPMSNMMATFNVIEACVRSDVRRLVNISSIGVPGLHYAKRRILPDYLPIDEQHRLRPQDPYGLSKLFGEQLCDAAVWRSDLRCISLRPAWVQDAASYATDLGPLIRVGQPRGVAGWPYTDVLDLAEAVRLGAESDLPGHEAFYIAAPDTIGGVDLHASWRTANPGSATQLRPVPRPDASGIDSGKARRLLGWQATRSWRDYLTGTGEPR